MMDTQAGTDRLEKALLEIDEAVKAGDISIGKEKLISLEAESRNEAVLSVFEAYEKEQESIQLEEGGGRTAAEFINLYPPGIPLVVPGEKLDEKIIGMLLSYGNAGFHIQGIERGCIRVIKEA